MATLYWPTLEAVGVIVTGLTFSLGGKFLGVQVLREPVTRDQLPDLPKAVICPCQGEGRKRFCSGAWDVWRPVQVAIVAASNLDLQTALCELLGWRDQVQDALETPTALGIASIMQVDLLPDDPLDRGYIPQGLDFSSVRFRFHSLENDQ